MPFPDASVSKMKGFAKLGKANTGAVAIACFNVVKATVAVGSHVKLSFLRRFVSTEAVDP